MTIIPDLSDLVLEQVSITNEVTITVHATSPAAPCPCCGIISKRIQSRYTRTLRDLPASGRPVHLMLRVRRFFCQESTCVRKIFAERFPSQKHALPPDLRARMEREARAGEFKLDQAKAQSEQELQRLLGNPAPVPGTAPTTTHHAHGASAPKASPETHQGTHSQTRVERAAARDSVGEQVQTRTSPTCTFFGVVPIEPKRLLDSDVRLFACPDCARTRTLSPRNGVLRFPAHSKRKTRTPVTSKRWAMEKTIWEVVGGERK